MRAVFGDPRALEKVEAEKDVTAAEVQKLQASQWRRLTPKLCARTSAQTSNSSSLAIKAKGYEDVRENTP